MKKAIGFGRQVPSTNDTRGAKIGGQSANKLTSFNSRFSKERETHFLMINEKRNKILDNKKRMNTIKRSTNVRPPKTSPMVPIQHPRDVVVPVPEIKPVPVIIEPLVIMNSEIKEEVNEVLEEEEVVVKENKISTEEQKKRKHFNFNKRIPPSYHQRVKHKPSDVSPPAVKESLEQIVEKKIQLKIQQLEKTTGKRVKTI